MLSTRQKTVPRCHQDPKSKLKKLVELNEKIELSIGQSSLAVTHDAIAVAHPFVPSRLKPQAWRAADGGKRPA